MKHVFAILLLLASANAASAQQTFVDRVIAELRNQGFTSIQVSRTWLGRARIEAQSPRFSREVVVNPRTGEILRDYWSDDDSAQPPAGFLLAPSQSLENGEDGDGHGIDGLGGDDGEGSDGHGGEDGGGDGGDDGGDHDGGDD